MQNRGSQYLQRLTAVMRSLSGQKYGPNGKTAWTNPIFSTKRERVPSAPLFLSLAAPVLRIPSKDSSVIFWTGSMFPLEGIESVNLLLHIS